LRRALARGRRTESRVIVAATMHAMLTNTWAGGFLAAVALAHSAPSLREKG
jgi:hypothetical protein